MRATGVVALYDLTTDPGELKNISHLRRSNRVPPLLERMLDRLYTVVRCEGGQSRPPSAKVTNEELDHVNTETDRANDMSLLRPQSLRDYRMLLESIVACEAVGVIGGVATATSVKTWFPTLRKPSFAPPGAVFGPVWTILYFLMGVSLYAVRKAGERGTETDPAIRLFAVQLALNGLWSFLFFGARSPRLAVVEIIFLWAAIALTMRAIWKIAPGAALLLAPYLLWTTFAVTLNYRIWRLNS